MGQFNNIKALSLYHYPSCPYCARTREAIKQTNLVIEQHNIQQHPHHRKALIQGGGKAQVPCLLIEKAKGQKQWLYESADIIDFVRRYAGVAESTV